jgi:hypothetical protein
MLRQSNIHLAAYFDVFRAPATKGAADPAHTAGRCRSPESDQDASKVSTATKCQQSYGGTRDGTQVGGKCVVFEY